MKNREQIIQKLSELHDDMQKSNEESYKAGIAGAYSDAKMLTDMASEAYAKMTILEWVLRDEGE